MASTDILTCPFCGFKDNIDYQMLLHVEVFHSENGDSPFVVKDAAAASSSDPQSDMPATRRTSPPPSAESADAYVDCPFKCGEKVSSAELQFHTDFHVAENMAFNNAEPDSAVELSTGPCSDEQVVADLTRSFSTNIPKSIRSSGQPISKSSVESGTRRSLSLKDIFFGSSQRKQTVTQSVKLKSDKNLRLGTAELGPYAHETRMPTWLQRMLEDGAKVTVSNTIGPNGTLIRVEAIANETSGIVPILAQLSLLDRTVARAFYCSPEVRHIHKMPKEGGFCGYRNIQMLISYIKNVQAPGYKRFLGKTTSILKLQDMIENAWDLGYNSSGKIETGGIKLTRKYIGTPEAQALFQSVQIPCDAEAYSSRGGADGYSSLMNSVFNYFEDEITRNDEHRVFITQKPPIYFQHQGHSMTIVGVEVYAGGAANLVVFDPMFSPSPIIKKLVGARSFRCSQPGKLLKAHRRGEHYLSRYQDFELLKISNTA